MSWKEWMAFGQKLQAAANEAEQKVSGNNGVLLKSALLASARSALEVAEDLQAIEAERGRR